MKSNYKPLGDYIQEVNVRNAALEVNLLLGVSIQKKLMPSIANTIGTNMGTYKIIKRNQFAYGPVTSRNGDKISIALMDEHDEAIVSQAYTPFEVIDTNELHPEYLMMWFRRPEFDRYARFMSHGSAREIFGWEEMCNTLLPIPSPEKQREIVAEYNVIQNRIKLNNQLIQKLEETAQTIYKQWFVDFEFPDKNGKPYKSNGGKMVYNEELDKEIPEEWEVKTIDDCNLYISDLVANGSFQSIKENVLPTENQNFALFVRNTDLKSNFKKKLFVNEHAYNFLKKSKLYGGEIIIPNVSDIGTVHICPSLNIPMTLGNNCIMVRSEKMNYWLFNFFKSFDGQSCLEEATVGSVQKKLSKTNFKNIKLLRPPKEIVEKYNSIAMFLQKNIDNRIKLLTLLNELTSISLAEMSVQKISPTILQVKKSS